MNEFGRLRCYTSTEFYKTQLAQLVTGSFMAVVKTSVSRCFGGSEVDT